MTRRGKLEVVRDILQTISEGRLRKTRIMYKSNTNPYSINKYLKELLDYNLISYEAPYYFINEYGIRVLTYFTAIQNYIP